MFKIKTKINYIPLEALGKVLEGLEEARIPCAVVCSDAKLTKYSIEVENRFSTDTYKIIAEVLLNVKKEG